MNTTDHLTLIESKCEANLDYLQLCRSGGALITKIDLFAEAGWKSTLAAIKWLRSIKQSDVCADQAHACNHPDDARDAINEIIAAWPIELLQ